jgi:N-acetylmuramoyl-L-alanine amidase
VLSALFSSAEVIDNGPDHTLRLYLKKKGAFYGWDADYNDQDQLCFQFLKPAVITAADNAYGADLTGVTVMLDVGHGGKDGGAVLKDENGKDMKDANGDWIDEAAQNLKLAMKLKAELESMGATVIMNREDDRLVRVDERLQMLKSEKPDLCVCIHHNSIKNYPEINGLITYYYTPFSQAAARAIYNANEGSSVYAHNRLDWLVYYTSRQTACPVVLTENGYVTSPHDVSHMLSDASVLIKAQAIAQGVADYFLAIQ